MNTFYTPTSESDIESIYQHIATTGGTKAAERTIDAISATCEDLSLFPQMGRRRPELDMYGLQVRSITERGHLIVYTEHDDGRLHRPCATRIAERRSAPA